MKDDWSYFLKNMKDAQELFSLEHERRPGTIFLRADKD